MRTSLPALGLFLAAASVCAQVRDLNTPREFPKMPSVKAWAKRAEAIRWQARMSCGLWFGISGTPVNAKVFGRVERDGYTIEKVWIETYPGFFLAGNLYRPLGKGSGPFPGILNPHGHWANGRMADEENGSLAARCITFARQGMIAFTYDMAGYNDTKQVSHKFGAAPENQLWNISLMGLQTANSIRALDFLESLPDVDKKRLACTGESGGGTQTFMLGAIDMRLAAQAPIVMVSHSMQGGCLCENAPGLRVDYSNMEIAAAAAPRRQIIVAATGDWTKKMMTVEGPAIASAYARIGAKEDFRYTIFDYPHNYNKTTREAVYAAFGEWLLNEKNPAKLKEAPYKKEADAELLVFPDGQPPAGALGEEAFTESLKKEARQLLRAMQPKDSQSLKNWNTLMRGAWEHALQLPHVRLAGTAHEGEWTVLKREPESRAVRLKVLQPAAPKGLLVVVAASGDTALPAKLQAQGATVLAVNFPPIDPAKDQITNFYTTYNRTEVQSRVADLQVVAEHVRDKFPGMKPLLAGLGDCGLASLAAAPLFAGVLADCGKLDESSDAAMLAPQAFFPGLRLLGSYQGIAALAAPGPIFLHNADKFKMDWPPTLYTALGAPRQFRRQGVTATEGEMAEWLAEAGRGLASQK